MSDTEWTDTLHSDAPTVLIVASDAETLSKVISRAGFDVEVELTPDSAALKRATVIVIDSAVPESAALIAGVIATPFGARVVVGVDMQESGVVSTLVSQGAHAVVARPLQAEELIVLIRRFVAEWYRMRQLALQSTIVDHVIDVVIATDREDHIVFVNPGAVRILEAAPPALMGVLWTDLLHPVGKSTVDGLDEYRIGQEDETRRWIRGSWRMVRDPADRTIARLLVARDVTRERQLRQDLVRSAALAELGMMAAEVAHEVNNPATYLMTNLSILRDDLNAGTLEADQAIELIEECLDGVTRITDIVRRMRSLATAHVDEGTDEWVDLGQVVRDVSRIAGLRVKYKAEIHIHDTEGICVHGSAKRLGQVVLNLVVNAADALTGQIDPMPRIDVTVKMDDGWACVDVRDNGPGVSPEMAVRMFEAFVTSKAGEGGTGLGLAVSRTIADEHGGALLLQSHGDRGAWFRIRLPLPDAT